MCSYDLPFKFIIFCDIPKFNVVILVDCFFYGIFFLIVACFNVAKNLYVLYLFAVGFFKYKTFDSHGVFFFDMEEEFPYKLITNYIEPFVE